MTQNVSFAMLTDPGRVRRVNQDACAADPALGAFVVCDGMGGVAGGEVASHMAADTFLRTLAQHEELVTAEDIHAEDIHAEDIHAEDIQDAVEAANAAIYQHAQGERTLHGMGTTLVALVLGPEGEEGGSAEISVVHVGDSRCYLWRDGTLHQLTDDHSLVEEQIRAGQLTRSQAERSPYRNIITRAVGPLENVDPSIETYTALSGDLYLLASDGLTRELAEGDIADILDDHLDVDLDVVCRALVDAANEAGGKDNITVLLLEIK